MGEKLTLVRLALRGDRAELVELFYARAISTENRMALEYQASGDSPAYRAQEGVAAAFREAALIVQKRIDEDAP